MDKKGGRGEKKKLLLLTACIFYMDGVKKRRMNMVE